MGKDFPDHSVINRLGNISLEARQPMLGNVSGRHRSSHRGSSVEFAEYRKYVPGDDTRRLDWKAYARSDRYYIKEFEADTNLRAHIVLDCSGSMGFSGKEGLSKLDMANRLSSILAYLAVKQGDAVGLTLCRADGTLVVPTSRRPAHLQVIYDQMRTAEPTGATHLVNALHTMAEKIPRRGLVLVFSDLFTDVAAFSEALLHLKYRKHDVAVFHLMDPLELSFAFDRPTRFVDMEGGCSIVAEPSLISVEYHRALDIFLEKVKHSCLDVNADYRLVRTDQSLEEVLREFLVQRLGKKGKR